MFSNGITAFWRFISNILKQYFIWLLTIPINFIPVCAIHKLDIYAKTTRRIAVFEWIKAVISDKDFLFVCIATLWALYVGMHFLSLSGKYAREYNRDVAMLTLCSFIVLLMGYILICSNSWWADFYQWLNPLAFNVTIGITTCIIGFVSILLSAIEDSSTSENECPESEVC